MKNSILAVIYFLISNCGFSQFNPIGTSITTDIFRTGKVGLGYNAMPTFGTYTSMFNGNSFFQNSVQIGNNVSFNQNIYGFASNKSMQLFTSPNNGYFEITNGTSTLATTVTNCIGCYSNVAVAGDVVINARSAGSLIIANENNGNIKFETGLGASGTGKVQMMLDKNGSIGIGTGSTALNPLEKLAVNGLIHTKEVKVDLLNWPDFVFSKNYNLPTLQTIEKQIQDNGHLANIPSAKEVAENGVLLGVMNKNLLQKIEELTLYLIQINKDVQYLKAQLKTK